MKKLVKPLVIVALAGYVVAILCKILPPFQTMCSSLIPGGGVTPTGLLTLSIASSLLVISIAGR